jgi:hypothetical protein
MITHHSVCTVINPAMGSGKSSLDNSQWRPNKRMAGIPRARDLPASLPRRRLSDRVIRASLAPLASRLARASRRLARRNERPRLRSRAALDRRARSPRSIDDARVDLPRNTIVGPEQKERNSTDRRVGKDDGARQKTPPPWSRAVRRCAWERGVDTPLGARARDERRGARDYDTKRRDDDARAEFEISIGARGCATMTRSGSRSSGRGTRQGAKD